MNNLKTKKLSIILFLTLIVSIFTNAYLLWEVRSSARLPGLFNPSCWPSLKAVYPENGITTKDMNDILLVFRYLEIETDDAGILLIKVFDSQHVLITTGHIEGSLSGGGRIFGFIKTDKGWIYDKKNTETFDWVS